MTTHVVSVVVQEFGAGERASAVWPTIDKAQRCHLAGEFGAVVGRLFGRSRE